MSYEKTILRTLKTVSWRCRPVISGNGARGGGSGGNGINLRSDCIKLRIQAPEQNASHIFTWQVPVPFVFLLRSAIL